MKFFRLLLVAAAATALLAGCGGESASETTSDRPDRPRTLEPVAITLDWNPGPATAGIMTAWKLGYFEDVGFELTYYAPQEVTRGLPYLVEEGIEVAVSHAPQVALMREKGFPIVPVGAIVPESTISVIWLEKSQLDDLSDLKGKTIAFPGLPFQKDFLEVLLAEAGLTLSDVKLERVEYDLMPALVSGRADAIFGGSWNVEGAALEARGLDPVITRASDLGIPDYDELVLMSREDRVLEDPGFFRRFMSAVRRGTATAIEDPEVALEAINEASYELANLKETEAGLEATLPLLSRTGRLDPEKEGQLVEWMQEEGLLQDEAGTPGAERK